MHLDVFDNLQMTGAINERDIESHLRKLTRRFATGEFCRRSKDALDLSRCK